MELEERITFLKGTAIFEDTTVAVLQKLAPLLNEIHVNPGSDIILKGDDGDCMFLIVEGCVKVHDGDHLFSTMKRYDGFGSYYLIDHIQRAATVTAEEQTLLLCISQEVFDELSKTDSSFSRGMLRTLVKRLREMNRIEEQLAELNATKDKFFSIIAHDLRGPLSAIISLSELLRDNRDDLSEKQVAEIINNQYDVSWQSLKLLDNLIKWAQLQTGRLVPYPKNFDLHELINDLIDFSAPVAEEKNISLHIKNCQELEVYADEDMIRTVMINLINNAIKFTSPGGSVTVSCKTTSENVLISVEDTGVGIDEARLKTLFLIDQSISTDGTANEKGTGLGLILCKEFVEKNNGTITASSTPGVGSRFTFKLPLSKPE